MDEDTAYQSSDNLVDQKTKVYKWRWYMLATLYIINFTNGFLWISFSPVADKALQFYHTDNDGINWYSQVFAIVTVVGAPIVIYLQDRLGLRFSMNAGALCNLICAALRVLSCFFIPPHHRYAVALIAQLIGAVGQPLAMFTTTLLAADWFPPNGRTLANTLATQSNPFGVLVAFFLSPRLVQSDTDMWLLHVVGAVPAVLAMTMSALGVWSSRPAIPPSIAQFKDSDGDNVKKSYDSKRLLHEFVSLMKNRAYLYNAMLYSLVVGVITSYSAIFEQYLCVNRYTNQFSGYCGVAMLGASLVGGPVCSWLIDRTGRIIEINKVMAGGSLVGLISFSMFALYPDMEVYLILSLCLGGFFGMALFAVSLDLGVECCYPVSEELSTGVQVCSFQLTSFVFVYLGPLIRTNKNYRWAPQLSYCGWKDKENVPTYYDVPNLMILGSIMNVIGTVVLIWCLFRFKVVYKRRQVEEDAKAASINDREDHNQQKVRVPIIEGNNF